jgi:hypothetical protein
VRGAISEPPQLKSLQKWTVARHRGECGGHSGPPQLKSLQKWTVVRHRDECGS